MRTAARTFGLFYSNSRWHWERNSRKCGAGTIVNPFLMEEKLRARGMPDSRLMVDCLPSSRLEGSFLFRNPWTAKTHRLRTQDV